jgi:hypothetical protein
MAVDLEKIIPALLSRNDLQQRGQYSDSNDEHTPDLDREPLLQRSEVILGRDAILEGLGQRFSDNFRLLQRKMRLVTQGSGKR